MRKAYWVSNKVLTCGIECENDIVVVTCNILAKFKGQPLQNLINWMSKQKGFEIKEIS